MRPRILLVNPPIYDFAAYDFWLRPYGLLSVAGQLRGKADIALFDYLDRPLPALDESDRWGRGRFRSERVNTPACLDAIPRYFHRFGVPRDSFRAFLARQDAFDGVLVQTMMSYWYPGVQEVIEDIRRAFPTAKIVLGGNYVTICAEHARGLDADLCIVGTDLDPLWRFLAIEPDAEQTGLWEMYNRPAVGALKLSDGCLFHCTYCSVPRVYEGFRPRSLGRSLAELELLVSLGARDVAFYDDALLFKAETVLMPFLEEVLGRDIRVNFHTPNALNARFIQADLAKLMVRAGFRTFYLGFESRSPGWQQGTGGKVHCDDLVEAVRHLVAAGADPGEITAYQIVGHPDSDLQELEASMHFVHSLGIRGMLADFSPIPGTPDGDACRRWVDMDEPLMHNKTAFPILRLGFDEVNRLKDLQRKLNRTL
ncbi:B12-binding domain-containing radical SAM protein [Anaerobaca lacustris]|uniref:B12-binding domain-containing radical SAM protein n=1 Tax=Anaerobaca lacustris TaxID=3044600 RepID=A0AAW6U231_9BACT|nr:B12-binding domain-containing radical SAM protein [Sedimentisphaerales bacterium M17dextr]